MAAIVVQRVVRATLGVLDFMRRLRRFQPSGISTRRVFDVWRVIDVSLPTTGFADLDAGC